MCENHLCGGRDSFHHNLGFVSFCTALLRCIFNVKIRMRHKWNKLHTSDSLVNFIISWEQRRETEEEKSSPPFFLFSLLACEALRVEDSFHFTVSLVYPCFFSCVLFVVCETSYFIFPENTVTLVLKNEMFFKMHFFFLLPLTIWYLYIPLTTI